MTVPDYSSAASRKNLWRSEIRRDQFLACVVGIACLAIAALLQGVLKERRQGNPAKGEPTLLVEVADSESMHSLAVTFPRLTLGGFRGLISTILWQQAEEDKNNRRWMDLETKYDIIAALQPYFVSVYKYHSWNQAYNLSAQWHEEDTKYKWVLDGIAYLYKGEEYIPGNADLMWEQGHLYFLKLGGASERIFYREHWRADIARFHELNEATRREDDPGTEALKLVHAFVIPDGDKNYRAYFHAEELPDPTGRSTRKGWGVQITDPVPGDRLFSERKDGKKPEEPVQFRYGLSPFYFAYVEYTRTRQFGGPPMTGVGVFDAWPGMALRMWCRDDLYYTGQALRDLYGKDPKIDPVKDSARFNDKIAEIHDCLRNIDMIAPKAKQLLTEHLGRFPSNVNIHTKHIREVEANRDTAIAEGKLFDALTQWKLRGQNMDNRLTDGKTIGDLFREAHAAYETAYASTMTWVNTIYPFEQGNPDRADFEKYATAIHGRQAGIAKMLQAAPTETPNMDFLNDDVVER